MTTPQVKDADEDIAPSVRGYIKGPLPEPDEGTPKQVLLARNPKAMHCTCDAAHTALCLDNNDKHTIRRNWVFWDATRWWLCCSSMCGIIIGPPTFPPRVPYQLPFVVIHLHFMFITLVFLLISISPLYTLQQHPSPHSAC